MVDTQDTTNFDQKGIAFTIRSVFVIDPSKKIRLTMVSKPRSLFNPLRFIASGDPEVSGPFSLRDMSQTIKTPLKRQN